MANRKPAAKPAARKKPAAKRKPAKKSDIDRRWSILLFALGALFVVLSFVPGSSVWLTLRENVLFGALGISGWLLGPFFIYWAVLVGLEKPVFGPIIKCLLFMFALSGAAVVFGKLSVEGLSFGEVLTAALDSGRTSTVGGGLLSLLFGVPLLALVGRPAANILIVLVVVIAAMVFTGVTPGDIVRFVAAQGKRIPKRDLYEDDYDDDEIYEEEPEPVRAAPPPRVKKRRRKAVDVDLGPDEPVSVPGKAQMEEVVIGPGGTFGMNPLGEEQKALDIEPFDPHSPQPLPQKKGTLLFGQDDPFADPVEVQREQSLQRFRSFDVALEDPEGTSQQGVSAAQSLFEEAPWDGAPQSTPVEQTAIQPPPEEAPGYGSVFAQPAAPVAAASGAALAGAPMAGDALSAADAATGDPDVQAMIDKAAAKKAEEPAAAQDNRPAHGMFAPYHYPPASLFAEGKADNNAGAREEMQKTADLLVSTLSSFGVQTRILDVSRGPSVTRYEIQPQTGVKISRITNLSDDIALNLAAAGVRIEAPIPGKPAVGIEVPNRIKSTVSIRSILESGKFTGSESPLTIALGKDIAGDNVVADLTKMPHLLVAGSTGSGKSVCINTIIMSVLYKSSPDDVRLMLIDPKVVELAEYNGIPHLLMPVVTEPRKAAGALGQMVAEMEKRYRAFAENNVRDIRTYNKKAERHGDLEKMPYIAIIIDELADLMMTSGKDVEDYICRIAQKARAAGMHLIVATQRPSVDVITGLIKANIPSRIAFAVSSQVDSRTILDGAGAEKLLGMGDMLFMPVGANKPVRVQGAYVKDKEISSVIRFVKEHSGGSRYDEDFIAQVESRLQSDSGGGDSGSGEGNLQDETLIAAVELALDAGEISTSGLQRRLRLGYARAGRVVDEMEQLGIVSGPNGSKPRQVLITRQQWLEMSMNAHG